MSSEVARPVEYGNGAAILERSECFANKAADAVATVQGLLTWVARGWRRLRCDDRPAAAAGTQSCQGRNR